MVEINTEIQIGETRYKLRGSFATADIHDFMELLKYIHTYDRVEIKFDPIAMPELVNSGYIGMSGVRGCSLCMKPLTGRQKKWCSDHCRNKWNRKYGKNTEVKENKKLEKFFLKPLDICK